MRDNRADELNRFKREINLAEYASSLGYELSKRESSRNSAVMRHSSGDKIVIATDTDGHGVYFSVRDDRDNGSIIDFVQRRKNLNIGQVRRELRPWLSGGVVGTITERIAKPRPAAKNLQRVIATWSKMKPLNPSYLESRNLERETLEDPRFSSMMRTDERGNTVFPHFNENGLCGYELKNAGFTGFSSGGEKGLWYSGNITHAQRVVICESAIDCLSHAQATGDAEAAYISTGGAMSGKQRELLQRAIMRARERGAEILSAVDRDDAGDKLHAELQALGAGDGRPAQGKDWNDVLAAAKGASPAPM